MVTWGSHACYTASMVEEMSIPRAKGLALIAGGGYALVLLFAVLAVLNLVHWDDSGITSLLASVVWLAILGFSVAGMFESERGFSNFLSNRMEVFASDHFVQLEYDQEEPLLIIGYRLGKTTRYSLKMKASGITRVGWSAGQGSSRTGQDLDDWSVVLWYEEGAPVLDTWNLGLRILGPEQAKEKAEALGQQLLHFLESSGIKFELGPRPNTYTPAQA